MVKRKFWETMLANAWRSQNIIWLNGVRRSGKTILCQNIPGIEYFDCELPRTRRILNDPEEFLKSVKGKKIVLDEIHRLSNPSELLKIAADHYPEVKIIATGSSSLGASKKFRDTLTGRKTTILLTPMISSDAQDFGNTSVVHRLHHGGLPPYFLNNKFPEKEIQEWSDSYWAKDIQELFRLEKRHSFMRFFEMIMNNSGGIFEANSYAAPCEISRSSISNYLEVLSETFIVHIIRPFSSNKNREIIAAPKVYGFDTGFVTCFKGWESLRMEDKGILWEHNVLNEMIAMMQSRQIFYWRDKQGHEIDFILPLKNKKVTAIECKWKANHFDPSNLFVFRNLYPGGENIVICSDVDKAYKKNYKELSVNFQPIGGISQIQKL